MASEFTDRVRTIISRIPAGKIATYGLVAEIAGNHLAARQVARILHSSSRKYQLPWHRVVNRMGRISLGRGAGYEFQKSLLEEEGVKFDSYDQIDLDRYLWLAELD